VRCSTLIVSQALIQHQDGVWLHPDLFLWQDQLAMYRQQWFTCGDKNPLAWYATLCDLPPAAILASRCHDVPDDTAQCWVVSPYHGQLVRNAVHVLPEGQFPWTATDAHDLCERLNPFLAEDGMQMFAVGAALLLTCREPMQVCPAGFASISGQLLPDRHHEGADGGRLNRLLSEIQMLLFRHPSLSQYAQELFDVNGIWLWAGLPVPLQPSLQDQLHASGEPLSVVTNNPALQSIVSAGMDSCVDRSMSGTGAIWIISEAERLTELLKQDATLPERILLVGQGYGVWLTKSLLRSLAKSFAKPFAQSFTQPFAPKKWQPKSVHHEAALLSMLRS